MQKALADTASRGKARLQAPPRVCSSQDALRPYCLSTLTASLDAPANSGASLTVYPSITFNCAVTK
jgi:hypothetical protein